MFTRKRNRLDASNYSGALRISLTLCTKDKTPILIKDSVFEMVVKYLKEVADRNGQIIWAYCFMPDHLHLLIESKEKGRPIRFVNLFKQKTGYHYKQATGASLWQKSYFDHILRREEDLKSFIRYIFNNPVRKGLVEKFNSYRYLGSFVGVDVMKLVEP